MTKREYLLIWYSRPFMFLAALVTLIPKGDSEQDMSPGDIMLCALLPRSAHSSCSRLLVFTFSCTIGNLQSKS